MRFRTQLLYSLSFLGIIAAQTGSVVADHSFHTAEFDKAIQLEPDLDNGRLIYRNCVACHGPEGWGTHSGAYPQIAGQLKGVIIKQLSDIRSGNRDNPIMRAFTSNRIFGEAQDIADVAGYIAQLPMTPHNDKGPSTANLQAGAAIYKDNCVDCHGENGEGNIEDQIPSLHSQHFSYLRRQFEWIRSGQRRNADEKMTKQILNFTYSEEEDVLAYTAAMPPPEHKTAADGWSNPDFPSFARHMLPGMTAGPSTRRP